MLALAATAGVAIENARLYEEAGRRRRWLEASAGSPPRCSIQASTAIRWN